MELTIRELKYISMALENKKKNLIATDPVFEEYLKCIEKIDTEIMGRLEEKSPLEAHFKFIDLENKAVGLAAEVQRLSKDNKQLKEVNEQLKRFNSTVKDGNKKKDARIKKLSADNLKLSSTSDYYSEVGKEYQERITELEAVVNKKNEQIEKLINRL